MTCVRLRRSSHKQLLPVRNHRRLYERWVWFNDVKLVRPSDRSMLNSDLPSLAHKLAVAGLVCGSLPHSFQRACRGSFHDTIGLIC